MADDVLNEHVRSMKRLLQILMLGCAFAVLIAFKTTTEKLLANSGIISMPVLGSTLRTHSFYMVAPVGLFVLWSYFLLRTHLLWELAHSRKGFRVNTPWRGVDFADFHMKPGDQSFSVRLSAVGYVILAWLMVPITLGLLWFKYLPRHQMLDVVFPTPWLWFALSAPAAVCAYLYAVDQLTGPSISIWKAGLATTVFGTIPVAIQSLASCDELYATRDLMYGLNSARDWVYGLGVLFVAITAVLCWGLTRRYIGRSWMTWAVPLVFLLVAAFGVWCRYDEVTGYVHNSVIANFRGVRTVDTGSGLDYGTPEGIARAMGYSFDERDLREANFRRKVLIKANFMNADLRNADLRWTWLHNAYFKDANLRGAYLDSANLMNADLTGAKHLYSASVRGTNIYGVRGLDSCSIEMLRDSGAVIQTQRVWMYRALHETERPDSEPCETTHRFRQWERKYHHKPDSCLTDAPKD